MGPFVPVATRSAARVARGMEGFEEVLFEDVFGVLEAVLVSVENARACS